MTLDAIIVGLTVASAAAYLVYRFWPRRRPAASPCSACIAKHRPAVPVKLGGTP
jgi:hypothetical protein